MSLEDDTENIGETESNIPEEHQGVTSVRNSIQNIQVKQTLNTMNNGTLGRDVQILQEIITEAIIHNVQGRRLNYKVRDGLDRPVNYFFSPLRLKQGMTEEVRDYIIDIIFQTAQDTLIQICKEDNVDEERKNKLSEILNSKLNEIKDSLKKSISISENVNSDSGIKSAEDREKVAQESAEEHKERMGELWKKHFLHHSVMLPDRGGPENSTLYFIGLNGIQPKAELERAGRASPFHGLQDPNDISVLPGDNDSYFFESMGHGEDPLVTYMIDPESVADKIKPAEHGFKFEKEYVIPGGVPQHGLMAVFVMPRIAESIKKFLALSLEERESQMKEDLKVLSQLNTDNPNLFETDLFARGLIYSSMDNPKGAIPIYCTEDDIPYYSDYQKNDSDWLEQYRIY